MADYAPEPWGTHQLPVSLSHYAYEPPQPTGPSCQKWARPKIKKKKKNLAIPVDVKDWSFA
ncbi:hypothetical protein CFP56_004291 [Quercus suber]|uniref:Uncharacterized protein n=1 Tax=Quercus suber TaxID=58331 RepID=A0AAW0LDG5_QUESU